MFSFFYPRPPKLIGFEDLLFVIKNPDKFILINTMPNDLQDILIPTTMDSTKEESYINDIIDFNKEKMNNISIVIYGKNCCDDTVNNKYKQIKNFGFNFVYIFQGGLFEYLLLHEIYGIENFSLIKNTHDKPYKTTPSKNIDILKYKPQRILML